MRLGLFTLGAPLASGGMGQVWRGRYQLGEEVAIKLLLPGRTLSDHAAASFQRELRAVAALDHPAILPIYDSGFVDEDEVGPQTPLGSPWLAMPLAQGTLDDRAPGMQWPAMLEAIRAILAGLSHAHAAGVIHRDLKPANVLWVEGAPPEARWKLCDFGIAHAIEEERETERRFQKEVQGSLHFMAPEQLTGSFRNQGPATDLYALGITCWWLVTGHRPFDHSEMKKLARAHLKSPLPAFRPMVAVPPGLEAWVRILLAKKARDRFASAADARAALDEIVAGRAIHKGWRARVPDRAPAPSTRPRALRGAGLSLFGLRQPPLVGRLVERATLWKSLRRVRSGARVVWLRGPAGVGKSRLARWLCQTAEECGAARALNAVHSHSRGVGEGLGGMIGRALRCEGLRGEPLRAHLEEQLKKLSAGDDLSLEGLLAMVVGALDSRTGWPIGGDARQAERFVLLAGLLARMAEQRPLILWLDDVHWGDEAVAFALEVLQRHSQLPILVVLTSIPTAGDAGARGALARLARQDEVRVLDLDVLPADDCAELLRLQAGLDPRLAGEVVERTGGHPLFALQMVAGWLEREALAPTPVGFVLKPGASRALPASLQQIWAERLDAVLTQLPGSPERARRCLWVAAALGQEIDDGEWRAACVAADLIPPQGLITALARAGLVEESAVGWAFRYALLRESLLAAAGERRSIVHRAVALALEQRSREQRGAPLPLLLRIADHRRAGGEPAAAINPLTEAARRQLDLGELPAAAATLDQLSSVLNEGHRMVVLRDELEARLLAADLERRQGRGDRSRLLLDHCAETIARQDTSDPAWRELAGRCRYQLGMLLFMGGDMKQAERRYREALGMLSESTIPRGACLRSLADCLHSIGEGAEGHRLLLEGGRLLSRLGDRRGTAQCELSLARMHFQAGQFDAARAALGRATQHYRELGSSYGLAVVEATRGEVARMTGDFDTAERCYRHVLEVWERMGHHFARYARLNLGLVLLGRGAWRPAERELRAVRADFETVGDEAMTGAVTLSMLVALAGQGDFDGLRNELGMAELLLDRSGYTDRDLALGGEEAGTLCLRAGRVELTRRLWRLAVAQWAAVGDRPRQEALSGKLAALAAATP